MSVVATPLGASSAVALRGAASSSTRTWSSGSVARAGSSARRLVTLGGVGEKKSKSSKKVICMARKPQHAGPTRGVATRREAVVVRGAPHHITHIHPHDAPAPSTPSFFPRAILRRGSCKRASLLRSRTPRRPPHLPPCRLSTSEGDTRTPRKSHPSYLSSPHPQQNMKNHG